MNFETEYKNIHFHITLEQVKINDVSRLFGDKFSRLPNQTLIELKKGNLVPFHLFIKSQKIDTEEVRIHYWSHILLMNNTEDLMQELAQYLEDEEILEAVVTNWSLGGDESGPAWKKPSPDR